MVLLAQISDLHLDGGERAHERAARVMDYLRALPLDALLVTGDIADHGAQAEYEEAAELLRAPFPVLTCPGNHDRRAAYRKALLGESPSEEPVNRLHHVAGTAILMADVTVPGRDEGVLSPETAAWIGATLDELGGSVPALLAFHQPPVDIHHPVADTMGLQRPRELAAVLASRPEVAAVITGHVHSAGASLFAGRPVVTGPGVVNTIRLPWEPGDTFADLAAPPGVAFHVLGDDRRLMTHFRVVP
ncbi:3',5'-cyclic adenosine monophosphate phosphodiesterase CpdA [Streptomyces sp. RB5]|uniref:3',5'-cyclic adenosine monophosphate phosphodiesterase CpdA n=1 Tax=Streptomyces smaragdinus TaxID=2585196 RepID=A0A7K0CI69_9ACTN|nr:metallophosphoesterase [Streptomyces smaragdinus]MQY13181.1 3',5'-cyclic adenosine monophosphate phosphodiesterase CpdA [Streptomyces smaragdinus]